jgi:ADP-glucose pyrophosphorylase
LIRDAHLSDAVIFDDVRIDGDAEVENSVLLPGSRLGKDAVVSPAHICSD